MCLGVYPYTPFSGHTKIYQNIISGWLRTSSYILYPFNVYPIAVNPIESDLIFIISIFLAWSSLAPQVISGVRLVHIDDLHPHEEVLTDRADKLKNYVRDPWILQETLGFKWLWINTIHTIFRGMNIHLPAILMFTRGIGFWLVPKWINPGDDVFILFSPWLIHRDWGILGLCVCFLIGPGISTRICLSRSCQLSSSIPNMTLSLMRDCLLRYFSFFLLSDVGMRHVPYEQSTWDTFSIRVLSQNWMKGRFRENPHVSYGRRFSCNCFHKPNRSDRLWPNTLLYNFVSCVHVV